jgi:uncharacterized protein YciI
VGLFVVHRVAGSGWKPGTGFDQHDFRAHEEFIDGLVSAGVVKLAGPLGDGRGMIIMEADDEEHVHALLAPDPWSKADILPVSGVTGWTIRLGNL